MVSSAQVVGVARGVLGGGEQGLGGAVAVRWAYLRPTARGNLTAGRGPAGLLARNGLMFGNQGRSVRGFDEVCALLYGQDHRALLLAHVGLRGRPRGTCTQHGHVHAVRVRLDGGGQGQRRHFR